MLVRHTKARNRNRVLRKIFGAKREEVQETGENCVMIIFMVLLLIRYY